MKVLKTIVKMYQSYRPLAVFGALAAVLMLLSIGFFIPVFGVFLRTGTVPHFSYALATDCLWLCGSGCDPIFFLRDDFTEHGSEKQAGF